MWRDVNHTGVGVFFYYIKLNSVIIDSDFVIIDSVDL